MHTRIILKRTPPILIFQYILRLGPCILQVNLKYTWARPENIPGPFLEKYVISIYLEKYTSRIFLQVLFQDTWSKYASSILTKVLFKHCSTRERQVYLKESWRSTYLAKYVGSILEAFLHQYSSSVLGQVRC